jgi:hypothetical protein
LLGNIGISDDSTICKNVSINNFCIGDNSSIENYGIIEHNNSIEKKTSPLKIKLSSKTKTAPQSLAALAAAATSTTTT